MLTLTRRDDWQARYSAFMNHQRLVPFVWGLNDCAIGFAFGAVEAITGHDMAEEFRDRYQDEAGAVTVMRAKGVKSLADLMALYLPEHHPSQADIGDIGIVPDKSPLGGSLCLFDATGVIVRNTDGHAMRPRSDATRSFKVG